jgi:hypothetical protein
MRTVELMEVRDYAIAMGCRVVVMQTVDLTPHTVVQRGETGTVERIDAETGEVWIKLDRTHRGLAEWDNCIWLIPPYTDDEVYRYLMFVT